jgi:hypothetical protein
MRKQSRHEKVVGCRRAGRLAVEPVAIGDRLEVLAPDVREQAGEVGTGMPAALRTGRRGDESLRDGLEATDHPTDRLFVKNLLDSHRTGD